MPFQEVVEAEGHTDTGGGEERFVHHRGTETQRGKERRKTTLLRIEDTGPIVDVFLRALRLLCVLYVFSFSFLPLCLCASVVNNLPLQ
jgi:hypothetical protein